MNDKKVKSNKINHKIYIGGIILKINVKKKPIDNSIIPTYSIILTVFVELGKLTNKIIIIGKLNDDALKEPNNICINELYPKNVFKMI